MLYNLLSCVCMRFGLEVDLHDSNFKRLRYQIQTWAALLGLTNEELLCEKQRNLQHLPFIYTGGPVCTCVCVSVHVHIGGDLVRRVTTVIQEVGDPRHFPGGSVCQFSGSQR